MGVTSGGFVYKSEKWLVELCHPPHPPTLTPDCDFYQIFVTDLIMVGLSSLQPSNGFVLLWCLLWSRMADCWVGAVGCTVLTGGTWGSNGFIPSGFLKSPSQTLTVSIIHRKLTGLQETSTKKETQPKRRKTSEHNQDQRCRVSSPWVSVNMMPGVLELIDSKINNNSQSFGQIIIQKKWYLSWIFISFSP